jgi:hypothetical protein
VYQLDLVPRLVGAHELPPKLMANDIGKNLLSFSQSSSVQRTEYKHWGKYYNLHSSSCKEEPGTIELSLNPEAFLSALPEEVLSIPVALGDHSMDQGYLKCIREIINSLPTSAEVRGKEAMVSEIPELD